MARKWLLFGATLAVLVFCTAGAQADVIGLSGRYVRVIKTDGTINPGDANRFHIGEIEVFAAAALPTVPGLDNANDLALSAKGAVGSTVSGTPQHGADSNLVSGVVNTGGGTWSRQNPLPIIAQVDLGATNEVGSIRVWQRGDSCCQNRLESFTVEFLADGGGVPGAVVYSEVHPGRVVPTNSYSAFSLVSGVAPGGVGVIGNDDIAGADVIAPVAVNGAKAVRLIQNVTQTFQIAEIEALEQGTGTNVAHKDNGGVATALNWGYGTNPTLVNDGNLAGNHPNEWHSTSGQGTWVQVDFATPATLDQFHIYGRTDCCGDRQDDFDLVLYDAGGTEIHRQNVTGLGTGPGANRLFNLEGPTGDVIAELLPHTHIFEVDAAALLADTMTVTNPLGGTRTLDLTGADIEMMVINGSLWNLSGQTFQILDADQFIGAPASITAPGLPDGFWIDADRLGVDGTVTFHTPEPATLSLLAIGGLALLRRRRRS